MNSRGRYNIHCRLEIRKGKDVPYANQTDTNVLLVHFNGGNDQGGWTWMPTIDEVQVIKDTLYYLNFTQSTLLDRYYKKKKKKKQHCEEVEYEVGHD